MLSSAFDVSGDEAKLTPPSEPFLTPIKSVINSLPPWRRDVFEIMLQMASGQQRVCTRLDCLSRRCAPLAGSTPIMYMKFGAASRTAGFATSGMTLYFLMLFYARQLPLPPPGC